MTPPIQITLSPKASELMQRFGSRAGLGQAIAQAMDVENELTLNLVRRKLSGPVLKRRTGRLRDSISRSDSVISSDGSILTVSSAIGSNTRSGGAAVIYAGPHEFGARIQIPPRQGRVTLVDGLFASNKQMLRALKRKRNQPAVKRVLFGSPGYTVTMPERSYLRSSLYDRAANYSRRIGRAVVAFYQGVNP